MSQEIEDQVLQDLESDIEDLGETLFKDEGFEPQEFEKPELFKMKPFQMIDFPSDQHVAGFAINDHNIAITTLSKKIFRWRFKDDPGCQELQLQNEAGDFFSNSIMKLGENVGKQLGTGLSTVGNVFLDTVSLVTKPLFNANLNKGKKNDLEEGKFDKIFLEPKGTHMVVSSDDGETFHSAYIEEGIRRLSALNGRIVRFLLWGEFTLQQFTNATLVTTENKFYNYSLIWNKEKSIYNESLQRSIYQLPVEKKICEVKRIFKDGLMTLLIGTDQSIYVLTGPRDLEQLFLRFKENPDALKKCEQIFRKSFGSMVIMHGNNLLWTDGFKLNYVDIKDQLKLELFQNNNEMKYAKKFDSDLEKAHTIQEQLYGVGLTRYHYYLLTFDTITILNIITQNVVEYFDLNVKMMGKVQGMTFDQATQCFWIYCKNGVYRLNTEFEDSEIWKLLIDIENYKEALEIARKYDSPYYGHIAGLYADTLFNQKEHELAAKYYIQSQRSFQEVFLQFSLSNDHQTLIALEKYLFFVLQTTQVVHQRQVLLGYVLELMVVRKCDENQIQKYLEDHLNELEELIVDQILQPHGLFELCNNFAELKNDLERVISNNIHSENLDQALVKLKQLKDGKQLLELVNKYSYVLMKFKPQSTLDIVKLLSKFDPTKLVISITNIQSTCVDAAVDFMEHCVEKLYISDKLFNTLYLFYLMEPVRLSKIIKFLNNQQKILDDKGTTNFDMMLAQRWFKKKKLLLPQIQIHSMLGRYEQGIQMALKNNLLSASKEIASKCEDQERQKQLWIMIVIWMLERGEENVQEVVLLTREVECLQVEDVLPFLNKNIKLDHFKAEICDTLLNYHDQVERLKTEMSGFYSAGESLNKEDQHLTNRYLFVSRKQKCEECYRPLFNEDFIIFGCTHSFHRDCLWQYVREHAELFDPMKLSKLQDLSIQLTAHESNAQQNSKKKQEDSVMFGFFSQPKEIEQKILKTLKPRALLEREFLDLLSNDCAICGNHIIESILQPFDGDELVEESWFI